MHAIHRLYPGSDARRQWLLADMEKLVEERSRIGVTTLGDLGDYFWQFIAITTYLCDKNCLSVIEQSRTCVHAFSIDFRSRISHCL